MPGYHVFWSVTDEFSNPDPDQPEWDLGNLISPEIIGDKHGDREKTMLTQEAQKRRRIKAHE